MLLFAEPPYASACEVVWEGAQSNPGPYLDLSADRCFWKVKQQANAFLHQRQLIGWQFTELSDQFSSRVGPNPLGVEGTGLKPSDA